MDIQTQKELESFRSNRRSDYQPVGQSNANYQDRYQDRYQEDKYQDKPQNDSGVRRNSGRSNFQNKTYDFQNSYNSKSGLSLGANYDRGTSASYGSGSNYGSGGSGSSCGVDTKYTNNRYEVNGFTRKDKDFAMTKYQEKDKKPDVVKTSIGSINSNRTSSTGIGGGSRAFAIKKFNTPNKDIWDKSGVSNTNIKSKLSPKSQVTTPKISNNHALAKIQHPKVASQESVPLPITNTNVNRADNRRFNVAKNSWYRLHITLYSEPEYSTEYKKGLVKIFGDGDKNQIFPVIKLPNIIFTDKDKIASVSELGRLNIFDIFFKTTDITFIQVYSLNLSIKEMKVEKFDDKTVNRQVNLWKLRRVFDLEFIHYYLGNLFVDYSNKVFIDKFNGEYKLFKNIDYFDQFIARLKINKTHKINTDEDNVLYLTHSSIQYEENQETLRTQNLLEAVNNGNYNVTVVTRYGYPYDKNQEYYAKKLVNDAVTSVSAITYVKLLNAEDNLNTNTLTEYLEKYITETIKLAQSKNAKIIHATTNFWNGIAAVYAAKYLDIKSVYEVRGFWEESTISNNPELYDSDILNMRNKLEDLVMQKADKIIAMNNAIKIEIIARNIDESKIEVIPDGIDIYKYSPNPENKTKLAKNMHTESYDGVIGYIGSILEGEGLELLISAIGKLKEKHNINYKLVFVGDGFHSVKINTFVKSKGLDDNYVQIKNTDHLFDISQYFDLLDIIVFPRNDNKNIDSYLTNLFRAMSKEKPIIVSDMYSTNGIMKDGESCLIFKNNDIDDLVSKILDYHNNDELKEATSKNSRQFVEKYVDWQIFGNKIRGIYDSL